MGLLADAVLLPPALATPITGILLALGTRWGHCWVTVKLVLTIGLATAAVFVLRPALNRGAAQALLVRMAELPTTGIGPTGIAVTLAPLGALQVLVATVTPAVFNPGARPDSTATDRGHLLLRHPPTPATAGVRAQHD
jgi:hypothetical protein